MKMVYIKYMLLCIKMINVDKKFYNELNNYEILVKKTIDDSLYNRLNQSILNSYMEINNV